MSGKNLVRRMLVLVSLVLSVLGPAMAMQAWAEDFTIIVLPDTQKYSASYPSIYTNQTQ